VVMDMDGFGSRESWKDLPTWLIFIESQWCLPGLNCFTKMTIGTIQNVHPRVAEIHTKTKLHSISIIYRIMKNYFACLIRTCYFGRLPIKKRKLQRSSTRNNCGKWGCKQNSPAKVTNDAASFKKKKSLFCAIITLRILRLVTVYD
jgi:hypothetical protein